MKDEERKTKDKTSSPKGKKRDLQKKIKDTLLAFADKIAAIKVLDPACGSGNFLYVALRLLLDLQNEVINFSDSIGAGRFFISVTPAQVYGIAQQTCLLLSVLLYILKNLLVIVVLRFRLVYFENSRLFRLCIFHYLIFFLNK